MTLYSLIMEMVDDGDAGNIFVNAFQYDVNDILPSSVTALSLATTFRDDVLSGTDGWEDVVRSSTVCERIIVTCPAAPSVLGINTTPLAGNRPTPSMPRFVAWGFKSERTRADIRSGFKRFGKLSEGDTNGDVPGTAIAAVLDTLAAKMNAGLNVSDGITTYNADPIIVKRIKYTTPSGSTAYRLPGAGDPYEFMPANWVFDSITTQNSRKL